MEFSLCESMPLKKKDDLFMHLYEVIDVKRRMLMEKQQKIRSIATQNEFLEDVKRDYSRYHEYIIQQKQDQMKALRLLEQYIRDLTISGQLSKQNIVDAKQEQRKIIHELNSIKYSLDDIIRDTDHISSILKK
jgi:cell division septum initiation protein DivIVA